MRSLISSTAKCCASLLIIPFFVISIISQSALADPSGYTAPPPPHTLNYLCTTSQSERFSGTIPLTACATGYLMLGEACTPTSFVTTAHLGSFASVGSIGLIRKLNP